MKDYAYDIITSSLRWFAKQLLKKHRPKIIAVTGSVGKTNTKRAIAAVVETEFETQWHEGNFNSQIGLPLALYELYPPKNVHNPLPWLVIFMKLLAKFLAWNYPYSLLVLELGISEKGDMDRFLSYIKPDIGVVTAIQPAHLEGFGSIDTVFEEKMKMAAASDHVVVNGDDIRLHQYATNHPGVIEFGTHERVAVRAFNPRRTKDGTLNFTINEDKIESKFIGIHSLLALAAGWTVGEILGVDHEARNQGLEELPPYPGRMNLLKGKKSSLIIDDSYNAVTPQAVIAALDTLESFEAKRRIAIIGNMNELGDYSKKGHEEVGQAVAEHDIDYLFTIGDYARKYLAKAAQKAGMKKDNVKSFKSPYRAGNYVAKMLKSGDVVLVKGSQNGVFAEEATALLLELESDRSKLVRQSAKWQSIKHEQFHP